MSGTPSLGSFNKDKVANKFGIQLKNKGGSKQSTHPTNEPTTTTTTAAATVAKNKTVGDFRLQNQFNGFQSNPSFAQHSTMVQSGKSSLQNSVKSKSSIGLASTATVSERRTSFTSNDNHSTLLKPVKPSTSTESRSKSPSLSDLSSLTKSPDTITRASLSPSPTLRDRSASPQPSSIRRTSLTNTSGLSDSSVVRRISISKATSEQAIPPEASPAKRPSLTPPLSPQPSSVKRISVTTISTEASPVRRTSIASIAPEPTPVRRASITKSAELPVPTSPTSKRPSIPITPTKTEAQIEHQKDQPLYKRQLTKTIDNASPTGQKGKHPHELINTSTMSSKGSEK